MNELIRMRYARFMIVLVVLAGLLHGGRSLVAQGAKAHVAEVTANSKKVTQELEGAEAALTQVKQRHLRAYVGRLNFDPQDQLLLRAVRTAKHAVREDPDAQNEHADQAQAMLTSIRKACTTNEGYFAELDTALSRYQTEPGILANQCQGTRAYISQLIGQGYFASHFTDCLALVQQSEDKLASARQIAKTKFEDSRPDYLRSYRTTLEGEHIVREVRQSAESVPKLRASNLSRISVLRSGIPNVRSQEQSAIVAADFLSSYPKYDCSGAVRQAGIRLDGLSQLIDQAEALNSMATQDFSQAANDLSQCEGSLHGIDSAFTGAINTRDRIRQALSEISNARSSAASKISSAQGQISSNSQNSQGSAESYLSSARSYYSDAQSEESSDPIESVSDYESAESSASSAYGAVDTSVPPPPSTDDYSSSSSSHSSSWGGGSSSPSSSSSSYSGGSSSPSGGGRSSAPSGGGRGSGF